ncbi:MAG: bifunctional ADP-dependent NAD(P)H-hydrate dehydratase/NAD(P)H-hydrate epimerase [Desulfobulbus sp.]|nr:MAG: bifunctional ADP-dependent NAD(P)H-hydrate dehydratase/NAD(P)H-hydrate epimerase [Desulfobulbus sp.]
MKLATSAQMQALDQTTIRETGVPGVVLMENAGRGTVNHMVQEFGPVRGKTVLIFIGPGNNGGDGLVIARHTLQQGGFPFIVSLVHLEKLQGDAAINADICQNLQIPYILCLNNDDIDILKKKIPSLNFAHPVHCIVDALFGTGLRRNIEHRFATIVELINNLSTNQHWPVIAVDIPSGLCSDTGQTLGCSVQANLTVTYGLPKPGHYTHGGPSIGKLAVVDIGIAAASINKMSLQGKVLDKDLKKTMLPRSRKGHKGSFGHLLVLAGSEGKTGAAILCGQAALHSGSGLVTLAVPKNLNPVFESALPEAMTVPLQKSVHYCIDSDYDLILKLLTNKGGLVLGPGLGTNSRTATLVKKLYCRVSQPVVVDADALNILSESPETLLQPGGDRILTPHPGEMARLFQTSTTAIQRDRVKAAAWLNKKCILNDQEIITVLKGAGTVVCSSKGKWAVNSSGNSGMATGGMGDVLAGLIGGLLVQGYDPLDAAELGVYLHGLSADIVAGKSPFGYLASDVARQLPAAIKDLQQHNAFLGND